LTITNSQKDKLNKMNRASQDISLGTIIQGLQSQTDIDVSVTNISVALSPYTTLSTDHTIRCNATTGSIVVKLLPATGSARMYNIKNLYTSACVVLVIADTTGTPDLIDGETTITIPVKSNMLIQDGALNYWDIL
jgi:hypothetical protein